MLGCRRRGAGGRRRAAGRRAADVAVSARRRRRRPAALGVERRRLAAREPGGADRRTPRPSASRATRRELPVDPRRWSAPPCRLRPRLPRRRPRPGCSPTAARRGVRTCRRARRAGRPGRAGVPAVHRAGAAGRRDARRGAGDADDRAGHRRVGRHRPASWRGCSRATAMTWCWSRAARSGWRRWRGELRGPCARRCRGARLRPAAARRRRRGCGRGRPRVDALVNNAGFGMSSAPLVDADAGRC